MLINSLLSIRYIEENQHYNYRKCIIGTVTDYTTHNTKINDEISDVITLTLYKKQDSIWELRHAVLSPKSPEGSTSDRLFRRFGFYYKLQIHI